MRNRKGGHDMLTLYNITLGYALYLMVGYNIIRQVTWYVNLHTLKD